MLFISILLSVWFVLWLVYGVMVKDFFGVVVSWFETFNEEAPVPGDDDENIYHLSCDKCGKTWWAAEPNTDYCPHCGKKFE